MISQMQPTAYTVPAQVLNAIGTYLSTRPYCEVVGLINGLREAVPIYPEADAPAFVRTPEGCEHVGTGTQGK